MAAEAMKQAGLGDFMADHENPRRDGAHARPYLARAIAGEGDAADDVEAVAAHSDAGVVLWAVGYLQAAEWAARSR